MFRSLLGHTKIDKTAAGVFDLRRAVARRKSRNLIFAAVLQFA